MISLPTFDTPFYTMAVPLDGSDYLFEWRHNQRENAWYFSLSLTDGTVLVAGVKVVCERSLLRRFANVHLPKGHLVASSNTTDKSPPGLNDFGEGKRITLLYFGEGELPAT